MRPPYVYVPPRFVIGDRARLKSGSPLLTVVDFDGGDRITVAWHDGNRVQERELHRKTLRREK